MSTFGTALVVDVAPGGELRGIAAALNALRSSPAVAHEMESGWTRVVAATADIETLAQVKVMLMSSGTCRSAVAEDYDEYGALWVVLSAHEGRVRTVHRRYVLNANPRRRLQVRAAIRSLDGIDPRAEDVAGEPAAVSAAELFDVPPGPMVEAERSSGDAFKGIGTVGGPFPWWNALWLPWPGEANGRPLRPNA